LSPGDSSSLGDGRQRASPPQQSTAAPAAPPGPRVRREGGQKRSNCRVFPRLQWIDPQRRPLNPLACSDSLRELGNQQGAAPQLPRGHPVSLTVCGPGASLCALESLRCDALHATHLDSSRHQLSLFTGGNLLALPSILCTSPARSVCLTTRSGTCRRLFPSQRFNELLSSLG
jgi:hypothetical protein